MRLRGWDSSVPSLHSNFGLSGFLLTCMGSTSGLWMLFALINEFVLGVVRERKASRLQAWSNWIREDLSSHPYKWLRPVFVLAAAYLVCKPGDSPDDSGIRVQLSLIDAHLRKAWMPYFRREDHSVVAPQAFLAFGGRSPSASYGSGCAFLGGEALYDAAMLKKSTAGGPDR